MDDCILELSRLENSLISESLSDSSTTHRVYQVALQHSLFILRPNQLDLDLYSQYQTTFLYQALITTAQPRCSSNQSVPSTARSLLYKNLPLIIVRFLPWASPLPARLTQFTSTSLAARTASTISRLSTSRPVAPTSSPLRCHGRSTAVAALSPSTRVRTARAH